MKYIFLSEKMFLKRKIFFGEKNIFWRKKYSMNDYNCLQRGDAAHYWVRVAADDGGVS